MRNSLNLLTGLWTNRSDSAVSTAENSGATHGNPARGAPPGRALAGSYRPRLAMCLGAAALALVAGCSDEKASQDPDFATRSTGLVSFESCETLLDYFHAEAAADFELGYGHGYGYGYGVPGGREMAGGATFGAQDATSEGNGAAPEAPGSNDYSGTNVQEAGVDEGDLVKTDGQFIYTVRGTHLLIHASESLTQASDLNLGYAASQILLSGDQLVVLGSIWDLTPPAGIELTDAQRNVYRTVVAIYDVADRAAPRLLRTLYVDGNLVASRLTGRLARLVISHEPNVPMPEIAYPDMMGGSEPGYAGGSSGAAMPAEERPADETGTDDDQDEQDSEDARPEEVRAEVPSEAIDAGSPMPVVEEPAEAVDSYAEWQAQVQARIAASTLDEWLPQIIDQQGDAAVRRPAATCEQFFRPGERAGLGTTVVLTVDLDQPLVTLPDPAVVTAASTVYASGENLFIATVNWRDFVAVATQGDVAVSGGGAAVGGTTSTEPGTAVTEPAPSAEPVEAARQAQAAVDVVLDAAEEPDNREATQIHRLALPAGGAATYQASGRVHGQLLNQFSMSELAGNLRVAATEHYWQDAQAARSVTRVTVLGGGMDTLGQTADVAPNEDIFAVRFVGERGFVVTFERTDPLFTVDLSNPAAPVIVGELEVLGYSTYLHPVDDDHLLGIGRSADENGFETGMQLSLFDVSNLADPVLDSQLLLGDGWSDALYDHHAVTFYEGTLFMPVNAWSGDAPIDGLQVFRVDVDSGIAETGTISHSALAGQAGYAHVERSLVIGDLIYSVSNVGLMANRRSDLGEVAHATFPEDVGGGYGSPVAVDGTTTGGAEPMPE